GPVSFMSLYDASTDVVKQGGTRRGANMGILRVDHPDVMDFVTCKDDITKITNFNISVAVTDRFMRAVETGTDYDLIHPRTGQVVGHLSARDVFARIVHGAWKTGEPGVFFIDRANQFNPVPHLGRYEATNPCGEQPLLAYDVCNLGSINVGLFARAGRVDWDALRATVHLCTHFLDNVIDANRYPLPEISDLASRIRRIGLGIMGWADMLVRLGIPYNSPEAVEFGRELMRFVDDESKVESERLASERGPFAEWERSIWGPDATCARAPDGSRIRPMRRLRNCNLTTVAPTGTISIISGCSSGIEPLFAVAFMRNQAGVLMPDVNQDFVAAARREGWYSDDLMKRIAEAGHIHFPEVPERWQRIFVTAHDVTPEWHIRMQAAFQDFTDSAISKTCNFPNSAREEDVRQIYELAYRLGCKGVTVYRDGSREQQVLSTGATAKKVQEKAEGVDQAEPAGGVVAAGRGEVAELKAQLAELEAELGRTRRQLHEVESENLQRRAKRSRPELLRGTTRRLETPLGTLYVTITEDDKAQPFEVFMSLGKAGAALMADVEAIGRLISLALRAGIPIQEIHRQLRGISSDRVTGLGPNKVLSVPDAIGIAIERWLQDKQGVQQDLLGDAGALPVETPRQLVAGPEGHAYQVGGLREEQFIGACPDCGSQLEYAEGCVKCHVCGYSECG
ncbi:MAG TPA: adenosylcobalamin-dependent ribonucleoside-diphosphate reductase, partial [Gemmatimonadales bacterium]|nr:adenosylcobalamin-dependent ribonucleoside-diphosphate reductase [Gemmatimonadales bacterium]